MDSTFEEEINRITQFISDLLTKSNKEGYIIGVSGGLDSAVVLKLLVRAVGSQQVFGLVLPERDTETQSIILARKLLESEKVKYKIVPITSMLSKLGIYKDLPLGVVPTRKLKEKVVRRYYDAYTSKLGKPVFFAQNDIMAEDLPFFLKGIAYYRVKHRMRMVVLYYYAEKSNFLVAGCTNLTEKRLGYYVRFGDDLSDVAPIAHLYKTEVKRIARELGVIEEIINRPPSPDLLPGITDEYSMGTSYETLDSILLALDHRATEEQLKENFPLQLVDMVLNQVSAIKQEVNKPITLERLEAV